jgi:hypothetical protein
MSWADIEPGQRLRVFGLMLKLLGSRITGRQRVGDGDDDAR